METINQALKLLITNKSRTLLTILGIMIGIACVIMVFSAGEGFKSYINYQIDQFGTNAVYIQTRIPPTTKALANGQNTGTDGANATVPITTLKNRDVEDIKRLDNVYGAYGASIGQFVSSYGSVKKNTFVFGSDEGRFDIDKSIIQNGNAFTKEDVDSLSQVALLGSDVATDFFENENPVGQTIKISNLNFLVIGVYEQKGGAGFSNDDQQIFIPITTLQKKMLGTDYLAFAVAGIIDSNKSGATQDLIAEVLRTNHGIKDPNKDDFLVQNQSESLGAFEVVLSAIKILLLAIASISLLVGGIGVMNIMYVSVTERIPEIGLKKSLGATNDNILREFVVEAMLLSILGGVIGIIFGVLISFLISIIANKFGLNWKFIVPLSGILTSVGISSFIGIFFGVFPARKASKLSPIESLRARD